MNVDLYVLLNVRQVVDLSKWANSGRSSTPNSKQRRGLFSDAWSLSKAVADLTGGNVATSYIQSLFEFLDEMFTFSTAQTFGTRIM